MDGLFRQSNIKNWYSSQTKWSCLLVYAIVETMKSIMAIFGCLDYVHKRILNSVWLI